MTAAWIALPLAALALTLSACGGDNSSNAGGGYPKSAEDNFLAACKTASGGKEAVCKCALAKLEDTLSYADFKRADAAVRGGGKATGDTAKKLEDAISGCA